MVLALLLGVCAPTVMATGISSSHTELNSESVKDSTVEKIQNSLQNIVSLAKEYYDDAYAYAYDKAIELGIIDAIKERVDCANSTLDELVAYVEAELSPEDAAEIVASVEATKDTFKALVALVKAADKLDAETYEQLVALVDTIKANVAELADVVDALANAAAYNEQFAAICNKLGAVKSVLAEVKAYIESMGLTVDEYIAAILNTPYDELAAAIVEAFKEYAPAAVEKITEFLVANKDRIVEIITTYGDRVVEIFKDNADSVIAFIGYIAEECGADVAAVVEKVLNKLLTFDYTAVEGSNIVAVGGSFEVTNTYIDIIADELVIDKTILDYDGLRISDLLAILVEDYDNDAYGDAMFAEVDIDTLREEYITAIAGADLITVDFGLEDFTTFALASILGGAELEWERFGNLASLVDADEARSAVKALLISRGVPEFYGEYAVADILAYAVECYAYAAMNYVYNYADAISAINDINPDAEILVLGTVNPLKNVYLEVDEDVVVDLGELAKYFVNVLDAQAFIYSALLPNTTFIPVSDAEGYILSTTVDGSIDLSIFDIQANPSAYINAAFELLPYIFAPSENGHEYIANQILSAMNFTCGEHIYDNDCDSTCNRCDATRDTDHVYNSGCDTTCNICGEVRDVPGHQYDGCDDIYCNECGTKRAPLEHTYDNACDTTCNACGATRTITHTYDDCLDTTCNVCGETRTAPGHTYGEWVVVTEPTTTAEGEKKHTCTVCGATETASIDKLTPSAPIVPDNKDDEEEPKKLGAGAIVGISIGSVAVVGIAGFAIYWFAVKKSTFAALGVAIKALAGNVGAAFKKLGAKIAGIFKKKG